MSEAPIFSPTTESVYSRLPEIYRQLDNEQTIPGPLPEIQGARNIYPAPIYKSSASTNVNGYSGAVVTRQPTFLAPEGAEYVARVTNVPVTGLTAMLYPMDAPPNSPVAYKLYIRLIDEMGAGDPSRVVTFTTGVYNGGAGMGSIGSNQNVTLTRRWTEVAFTSGTELTPVGSNQIGIQIITASGPTAWATSATEGFEVCLVTVVLDPVVPETFHGDSVLMPSSPYNQFRNSDFEDGTIDGWLSTGPTVTVVPSAHTRFGNNAVRITASAKASSNDYMYSHMMRVTPGVQSSFSVYARRHIGQSNLRLIVEDYLGSIIGTGGGNTIHTLTDDQRRYSTSFVPAAGVHFVFVFICIDASPAAAAIGDVIEVDAAMFNRGSVIPFEGGPEVDPRYPSDLYGWEGTPHQSPSYRKAFAADPGGKPLKRFLSATVDQVDEVAELFRRFKYVTPDAGGAPDDTSDLVDSTTADDAWLHWLAQMLGAQAATVGLTPPEIRTLLQTPELAYGAGTPAAIAAAAQKALTGTKYVSIYARTTNVSSLYGAGQWDLLIATRSSETASGAAVLQAIKNAGAKPAGVVLWHRNFETTWATLEATYTTWAQIDATPNWTKFEETGL